MQYYISLDLGGSSIKAGYGNYSEGIKKFSVYPLQNKDRHSILSLMQRIIEELVSDFPINAQLKGIAIGSPGIVDSSKGRIISGSPNIPGWNGTDIRAFLQKFSPVFVENDASLMAYGEAVNSLNGDLRNTLGITIGTGIGSAYIYQNKIFTGSYFAAMEIGHTIVNTEGLQCSCGKIGCLEAYSSVGAIERRVNAECKLHHKVNIEEILRLSPTSQDIESILFDAYDKLALVLANSVMILDPEELVIGGGITEISSFDITILTKRIFAYLDDAYQDKLIVRTARMKNKAGVWGGIVLSEKNKG